MILATLLALTTLTSGTSVALTGDTAPATAEGVEILRRLLVGDLNEAFQSAESPKNEPELYSINRRVEVHGLVTTLWAGERTVEHSRAFHMPEAGVFLSLDVSLPLARKKAAPAAEPQKATTDDEWERARRELRGDGTDLPFRTRVRDLRAELEIDPEAIERTTEVVLRTLARHAARVEGLAPSDTITVALRVSGRNRTFWQDLASEPEDDSEAPLVLGVPEDPAAGPHTYGLSAMVLAAGQNVPEQSLVIRISLGDLAAGPDRLDLLRTRARINRY